MEAKQNSNKNQISFLDNVMPVSNYPLHTPFFVIECTRDTNNGEGFIAKNMLSGQIGIYFMTPVNQLKSNVAKRMDEQGKRFGPEQWIKGFRTGRLLNKYTQGQAFLGSYVKQQGTLSVTLKNGVTEALPVYLMEMMKSYSTNTVAGTVFLDAYFESVDKYRFFRVYVQDRRDRYLASRSLRDLLTLTVDNFSLSGVVQFTDAHGAPICGLFVPDADKRNPAPFAQRMLARLNRRTALLPTELLLDAPMFIRLLPCRGFEATRQVMNVIPHMQEYLTVVTETLSRRNICRSGILNISEQGDDGERRVNDCCLYLYDEERRQRKPEGLAESLSYLPEFQNMIPSKHAMSIQKYFQVKGMPFKNREEHVVEFDRMRQISAEFCEHFTFDNSPAPRL